MICLIPRDSMRVRDAFCAACKARGCHDFWIFKRSQCALCAWLCNFYSIFNFLFSCERLIGIFCLQSFMNFMRRLKNVSEAKKKFKFFNAKMSLKPKSFLINTFGGTLDRLFIIYDLSLFSPTVFYSIFISFLLIS